MSQVPGQPYAGGPGTPGPGGMPPKKSNTLKILLIIGGVLLVLALLCCGGCWMLMGQGFNVLAGQVKTQYGSHPAVVSEIGADAEYEYSFADSIEEAQNNPQSNNQRQVFTVKGSKGSGKIIVTQQPGSQTFSDGLLRTSDGTETPLD